MSITVKTAYVEGALAVIEDQKNKGVFIHASKTNLKGQLERDGVLYEYDFEVWPGYRGNFASSPDIWIVQKLVPSYVQDDNVYNEGFDAHDWLYSVEGQATSGEKLERSEVDDFARGVMRLSPTLSKNKPWFARFRCSIMDLSVGLCAGNKRHWGNDSYQSRGFASFKLKAV